MATKREFNRADLTTETPGGVFACVLCGRRRRDGDIAHEATCVFAHNSVTGIRIDGISGGIVFRQEFGRWYWVSPASGAEYYIEKLPKRYAMFDEPGNEIKSETKLYTLRLWVGLNQGVL